MKTRGNPDDPNCTVEVIDVEGNAIASRCPVAAGEVPDGLEYGPDDLLRWIDTAGEYVAAWRPAMWENPIVGERYKPGERIFDGCSQPRVYVGA